MNIAQTDGSGTALGGGGMSPPDELLLDEELLLEELLLEELLELLLTGGRIGPIGTEGGGAPKKSGDGTSGRLGGASISGVASGETRSAGCGRRAANALGGGGGGVNACRARCMGNIRGTPIACHGVGGAAASARIVAAAAASSKMPVLNKARSLEIATPATSTPASSARLIRRLRRSSTSSGVAIAPMANPC
jgi:hypothetical protein